MKKKLILFPMVLLMLAIGSHYLPAFPVAPPVVPGIEKLDSYLAEQESRFDDITDGAEKTIVWANEGHEKTKFSVIYLHGYSATRQESAPVTDLLAKKLGANAFHTRLTGHGRANQSMAESKLKLWKKDALEAYEIARTLGDKVIVVSVSTGCTLSTWLATQGNTRAIAAQLMISPNFDIPNQDGYMMDLPLGVGVKIAEWTVGKNHTWTPMNELQEKYWSTDHPIKAIRPMIQLLKEVKKIDKQSITVPTLMVYSTKDTVILPSAVEENFAQFGSKKKQLVQFNESEEQSNHVLAGYIVSPGTVEPVLNILLDFLYYNDIAAKPNIVEPVAVETLDPIKAVDTKSND